MGDTMKHVLVRNEEGFALLMVMAILFGLLSLILPLALMNRQQIPQAEAQVRGEQAQWILQSSRALSKFASSRAGKAGRSKLQRVYNLPGWEDFPIRLKLSADGGGTITVYNILPYFMRAATSVGENGTEFTLTADIDLNGAPGVNNATGDLYTASGSYYLILGDELVIAGAGAARGLGGCWSAHAAGELVYGITGAMAYGYLKIDDEWIAVKGYSASAKQFVVDVRGYAGTKAVTHAAGAVAEFYPAFPYLRAGSYEGYVNIEISDERSRINVNSLSERMAENLFNYDGMAFKDSYKNAVLSPYNFYPFVEPDGVLQLANGGLFLPQLKSRLFSMATTCSEPDFARVLATPGPRAYLYGGTTNPLYADGAPKIWVINPVSGALEWGNLSSPQRILQHPVNFNLASVSVMEAVITNLALNTGVPGPTQANANTVARRIEAYRSGEAINTRPDYFNGNEFGSNENPFDGVNQVTGAKIGTAIDEFREFLGTVTELTAEEKHALLKHACFSNHRQFFSTQKQVTTPIAFDTGRVRRATATVSVRQGGKPIMTESEATIFKDITEGYSASNTYEVILDAKHGWNEGLSTFYSTTADVIPFYDGSTNPVRFRCKPAAAGNKVYSRVPGAKLKGHVGGGTFTLGSLKKAQTADYVEYAVSSAPPAGSVAAGACADFGLRVQPVWEHHALLGTVSNYTSPTVTITHQGGNPLPSCGPIDYLGYLVFQSAANPGDYVVRKWSTYNGVNTFTIVGGALVSNIGGVLTSYPPTPPDPIIGDLVQLHPLEMNWWDAANTGNIDPLYETVLIREGAEWTKLSWVEDSNGTATPVTVRYRGSQANTWKTATNGGALVASETSSDTLFIRIHFGDGAVDFDTVTYMDSTKAMTQPDTERLLSPQVFQVKAEYQMPPGRRNPGTTTVLSAR